MNIGQGQKKSSWPKQAAIVVSESPNVHMLLRELLRSYQWTVIDSTPSAEKAVEQVRTGQAYLILCDDATQAPVTKPVRHLLADPLTLCTPTLCFLLEAHKPEAAALSRMGRPVIVEKPLTPSKFIPGFVQLVRSWEKEPLSHVRRATYAFLDGNDAAGLKILLKLVDNAVCGTLCAQAIAMHLRRLGRLKEAEAILLKALKRSPKELGTVLALADLYMHAAMPRLAYRLLAGAKNAYAQSLAIVPDLVQAAILQGNMAFAIDHLYTLLKAGFTEDDTPLFLARLLFAEGREAEAERVLANNKAAFKKLQTSWTQAEAQPLNAAG